MLFVLKRRKPCITGVAGKSSRMTSPLGKGLLNLLNLGEIWGQPVPRRANKREHVACSSGKKPRVAPKRSDLSTY